MVITMYFTLTVPILFPGCVPERPAGSRRSSSLASRQTPAPQQSVQTIDYISE